ncbi:MAG: biotin/lipoyl-binding protein [Pseudomonas sp.]
MQGQRRVWLAAGLLGVTALGAGIWGFAGRHEAPQAAAQAAGVPVTLARVAREDLTQNIDGVGTVTSLASVLVRPQVEGQLTALLVEEGQMVKQGELRRPSTTEPSRPHWSRPRPPSRAIRRSCVSSSRTWRATRP